MFLFHKMSNQYKKAFCPDGEWLTLNERNHVVCEENPCTPTQIEIVLLNDDGNGNINEEEDINSNSTSSSITSANNTRTTTFSPNLVEDTSSLGNNQQRQQPGPEYVLF